MPVTVSLLRKDERHMWLFTETGFVSAVRHREDPDLLVVRARDRQSLEPIEAACNVEITTNA